MHTQHMPHIIIANRLEANKERFDPFDQIRPIKEGFDQIRPHSFRSLQFDQKVRPQSFRPETFDLFTATYGKRPDGVTMIPWEMGKHPMWDVTVVDSLAPSRLNQGSLCNPGTTATEAEARKIEKYCELIDNGYIFQPVALEVQGSLGDSSEIFITRPCEMLCRSHNDQRVGSFLKQRISMALEIGNAACVLGTVSDRDAVEEIYYK